NRVSGEYPRDAEPRPPRDAPQSGTPPRPIRPAAAPRREPLKRVVRVAGGPGFWGDDLDAPRRQVEGGPGDSLMLDYLVEVTMSILQKQKERDPSLGYARDFVGAVESVLPAVLDRGVKVVANAGGVNPPSCAAAVKTAAEGRGSKGRLKIGVVT